MDASPRARQMNYCIQILRFLIFLLLHFALKLFLFLSFVFIIIRSIFVCYVVHWISVEIMDLVTRLYPCFPTYHLGGVSQRS